MMICKTVNREPEDQTTEDPFKGSTVFLGLPAGDTYADISCLESLIGVSGSPFPAIIMPNVRSTLTGNFNALWCEALNARAERGVTHFAMIHSDIAPSSLGWLGDILLELLARPSWVCLSTVIPIKSAEGLTSTGMDTHRWRPRRFTMHEAYRLPETWGTDSGIIRPAEGESSAGQAGFTLAPDCGIDGPAAPLLLNTGLMICDIRESRLAQRGPNTGQCWAHHICFEFRNRNLSMTKDGRRYFYTDFEPEDWRFSRQMHAMGMDYGCTRKIRCDHTGPWRFGNGLPWGTLQTDTINRPLLEVHSLSYNDGRYPDMQPAKEVEKG